MSKPRKLPSGRWQAYLNVTEGGKSTQVALGTFATQRDARDAISMAEAARRNGTFTKLADGRTLVKDWMETWYAARLKPSRRVRSFLDARILPVWGEWRIADIRVIHLRQWVKDLADSGELNPSTVRGIYETMKMAFADAVEEKLIPQSPCRLRGSDLPALVESEYVFLTHEQGRVLEALAPSRFRAMIHLALHTGMRWGELAALRWEEVDLEAGWVTVSRAVKTNREIGPPKNSKARRLRITAATCDVLRAHRRDYGTSELIFTTNRQSKQLNYPNFRTNIWQPLVEASLFNPVPTFHDLRHTHCGWMIAQGMDWMVLADRMGHHKPSFTMDRYGHLRHDSDAVVLAALEAVQVMVESMVVAQDEALAPALTCDDALADPEK